VVPVFGLPARARAVRRRLRFQGRPGWARLVLSPDGRPAAVVFSAPGCIECRLQKAQLSQLPGLRLVELDVSRDRGAAREFGVMTAPTTVVIDQGGRVLGAHHGLVAAGEVARQLGLRPAPSRG